MNYARVISGISAKTQKIVSHFELTSAHSDHLNKCLIPLAPLAANNYQILQNPQHRPLLINKSTN